MIEPSASDSALRDSGGLGSQSTLDLSQGSQNLVTEGSRCVGRLKEACSVCEARTDS